MDDLYGADKPDTAQLAAAKAEILAFREQHRTLGPAALAIAFIERRGNATSAELSLLLDLGADRYPSVELRSSVQGERLVCKDRIWTLGPKAFPDTREPAVKPDALQSGAELGKQEFQPPVVVPRFAEKEAGKPLQGLKRALIEPPPPAPAKPSRCRFAVWSDGQVEIKVPGNSALELSRVEFDEMVRFVNGERAA
jgi:hypothetical protein